MEWQPIETAPKDGTRILGAWPSFLKKNEWFIQPVFFVCGVWLHGWDEDEDQPLKPTHWMPIPTPPQS